MDLLLFSVLVERVEVLALRGWAGAGGLPFAGGPLVLVELGAKRLKALEGVVAPEEFVALVGFVGTDVFGFAGPLPFASLPHVLPQYGYTVMPSLYCGFLLQCLKTPNHLAIYTSSQFRTLHTHSTQRKSGSRFRVHARVPSTRPRRSTCFGAERIILLCGGIPGSGFGLAILRRRDERDRPESTVAILTAQRPGPEVAGIDEFWDFELESIPFNAWNIVCYCPTE